MQRLVIVLAFIFAILVGLLLATTLFNGSGPASTLSPSPTAQGQASTPPASDGSASPAPSDGSGAIPSDVIPSESASPSASASASPSPSPTAAPLAVVTFTQLRLDATTDTTGADRVITFTGSGAGTVTATLSTLSTGGAASKMCLSANGKLLGCHTGTTAKLVATMKGTGVKFSLTVRGAAAGTPIVAVKVSFPAVHAAATITSARFDGTDSPDYNGVQVVVKPRANGDVKLVASWGGHPFLYEVDLIEQGGTGLQTLANQGPATKVSQSLAVVKPHSWMVVLQNIETGFGPTQLTATVSWP